MASRKSRKKQRSYPQKGGPDYHQLWRIVDGAVKDAFKAHPDYLTEKGKKWMTARQSIVKRVTGSIMGYTTQVVEGRSGLDQRLIRREQ